MGYDMTIEDPEGKLTDEEAYFRLNIWGMGRWRDIAMRRGALNPVAPPNFNAEGLSHEDVVAIEPEPVTGIPIYKLDSNDGWLCTPNECSATVAIFRLNGPIRPDEVNQEVPDLEGAIKTAEYYNEFVTWIERAADLGGFRVY